MASREKRLLMVSTVPGTLYGFVSPIAERMRERGWRVDAAAHCVSESEECAAVFDELWDVEWSRNPLDPSNLSSAVRKIREIAEDGEHEVVHVHTPVAAWVTRLALRGRRARGDCQIIYTAHGFHFHERNGALKNAAFLSLEKMAGQWTDRLVLINEYDVAQAKAHHLVPHDAIIYMHGIGIDTDEYDPSRIPDKVGEEVREELGVGAEPLFLVPAEFIPRKRQHLVVEALAAAERGDLHVAFLGSGPTLPSVRQYARKLGVDSQTHFLGFRKDMPRLMKAADATVLYSQQEGLSRSVMESLAMERAVIGSDIRGIRELVADGCGVAVDPDRPDLLASAMAMAADDPEWLALMGKLGRQKMAGPYEERRIVAEHEVMYEDVLSQL
jgi:glycosyltransferase involved in cell wall biosynthesis